MVKVNTGYATAPSLQEAFEAGFELRHEIMARGMQEVSREWFQLLYDPKLRRETARKEA